MSKPKIVIIGLSAAGAASLSATALAQIAQADLLAGGKRHLSYFPDFGGKRVPIAADMGFVAEQLGEARDAGQACVVLASGDPLCYGIGSTLRRWFDADALEVWPAPTAFQMAFAALGEPWHDAALLSAHARPLADVVAGVLNASKAAILTDNKQTPAVVAQSLLDAGLPTETACAVCENLGSDDERIVRLTLGACVSSEFAPLNVLVVLSGEREGRREKREERESRVLFDGDFSTSKQQITKREVRLLSLAELALGSGETMWDIGAGSGAVSIEAARSCPSAQVFAVEKRPLLCEHIAENLRRFPAPNMAWREGTAPDDCVGWPDPDCVFIGGSGGHLARIVEMAQTRLKRGGRLVLNVVTLENLMKLRTLLPEARVTQVQISRGKPIVEMMRLEALNPVFIVTWRKE